MPDGNQPPLEEKACMYCENVATMIKFETVDGNVLNLELENNVVKNDFP